MSTGTFQQLTAKGVQDAHINVDPETSFFKRTYKRHSQFAMETIDMECQSTDWGKTPKISVERQGDLLMDMYLVFEIGLLELDAPTGNQAVYWTNALGHAALGNVQIKIGGTEIDSFTGLFCEMYHEIHTDVNLDVDPLIMRGNSVAQLKYWSANGNAYNDKGENITRLYVHLPFYFTKAKSQCLPIIALQYHDISVHAELARKEDLLVYTPSNMSSSDKTLNSNKLGDLKKLCLMNEVIYLDETERQLFAATSHEYLISNMQIEQRTFTSWSADSGQKMRLDFSHPNICWYWVVRNKDHITNKDYFNYELTPGQGDDPLVSASIRFNNTEREKTRDSLYYGTIQPAQFWGKTPRKNVYAYSFAFQPTAIYPTGSVNLSRIDGTDLVLKMKEKDQNNTSINEWEVTLFAISFNVEVIAGGMAGKRYAN